MILVIDSNVLIADLTLQSEKVRLLLEYCRRTETKIVVPQVVLEEVEAHFERVARQQIGRLAELVKFANTWSTAPYEFPALPTSKDMTAAFMARLKRRWDIHQTNILQSGPDYLNKLIRRATNRLPPFGERASEFRDAVIWLNILDLGAGAAAPVMVSFISMNTRDFAPEGKLHTYLEQEATRERIALQYFPSIDAFLKAHADRIAFINVDFINQALAVSEIENQVLSEAPASLQRRASAWFARRQQHSTGGATLVSLQLELDDYYVYPEGDNKWVVIAYYVGEGDVEGEVYEYRHDREWSDVGRPFAYGFDTVTEHPALQVQVELHFEGRELVSWALIEADLSGY